MTPIGLQLVASTGSYVRNMEKAVSVTRNFHYIANDLARNAAPGNKRNFQGLGLVAGGAMLSGFGMAMAGDKLASGVLSPMIAAAAAVETKLREVAALSGEAMGSDFIRGLESKIDSTSIASVFSAQDIGATLVSMFKMGIQKSELEDSLMPITRMAEASFGTLKLEQAAGLGVTALQKFNIAGNTTEDRLNKINDLMFTLVSSSKMAWGDMSGFFNSMQAAPSMLEGTSTEELLAIGGALRTSGYSARFAGNNLASIANNMINVVDNMKKGGDASKKFKQSLDVLSLAESDFVHKSGVNAGKMKSLVDILGSINIASREALAKGAESTDVDIAIKKLLGTKKGISMLKGLEKFKIVDEVSGKLVHGMDALRILINKFQDSQGAVNRGVEQMRASWDGQMALLVSAIENVQTKIGKGVKELLIGPLRQAVKMLQGFNSVLASNPALAKAIGVTIGMLSTLLMVGGTLLGTFGAIILLIGSISSAAPLISAGIGVVFSEVGAAIVLVVGGLIAAGIAISAFVAKSGMLKVIAGYFNKISVIVRGVKGLFQDGFLMRDEGPWKEATELGITGQIVYLHGLLFRLKEFWNGIWEADGMKEALGALDAAFKGVGEAVGEVLEAFFPEDTLRALGDTDAGKWVALGKAFGSVLKIFVYAFAGAVMLVAWGIKMFAAGLAGFAGMVRVIVQFAKEFEYILAPLIVVVLAVTAGLLIFASAVSLVLGALFMLGWTIAGLVISSFGFLVFTLVVVATILTTFSIAVMLLGTTIALLPVIILAAAGYAFYKLNMFVVDAVVKMKDKLLTVLSTFVAELAQIIMKLPGGNLALGVAGFAGSVAQATQYVAATGDVTGAVGHVGAAAKVNAASIANRQAGNTNKTSNTENSLSIGNINISSILGEGDALEEVKEKFLPALRDLIAKEARDAYEG